MNTLNEKNIKNYFIRKSSYKRVTYYKINQ